MTPRPPRLSAQPSARRLLASLPVALLVAGCASAPPRPSTASSIAPAASWSATGPQAAAPLDPAALAEWWKRFEDPVLDQLLVEALAHNRDIRTALSRIEQARAARGVEKSGLFPSVDAGLAGQGSRTRDRQTGTSASRETYSASIDASWEIDLFGKQRLQLSAATSDHAQASENLHAAQVSLAAEVALAYLNLRSAEAQLAVVRRSLASREETTRLTQWREEAGLGDALATRQATSSLEQARAAIPSLEQTASETRNKLVVLCGRTPGSLDTLLASTGSVPVSPATPAVGIPAETLRQRPDIRAAGHAVEAAAARSASARRERLPSLSLAGSLGVEDAEAGRLFSPSATIASLAGGLVAPIFSAGRIAGNIRIQDETTRQALIDYEAAVLDALAEVENALEAIRRNTERRRSLEFATSAAREADALARAQYESGFVDFLQVLDAERTLLGVEQSLVATTADLGSAHVRLYKALGGGWSPESAGSSPSTSASL